MKNVKAQPWLQLVEGATGKISGKMAEYQSSKLVTRPQKPEILLSGHLGKRVIPPEFSNAFVELIAQRVFFVGQLLTLIRILGTTLSFDGFVHD